MKKNYLGKRTALLLACAAIFLSACSNNTADTAKTETNEVLSSNQLESAVAENEEQSQSDVAAEEENKQNVSSLENCKLRLIDCHQFENDDEQFTYLAFALLGPEDIGFHLEDGTSEISDAWLTSNHMDGGWRVVTCEKLPGGITLENLSLSVTDYSTPEEKTVLFSDWGQPMNKEELQTVGIYEIEGDWAILGEGRTAKNSEQYGFMVGFGLVGPAYGNPEIYFPTLENAAQVFQFYAADGTLLTQSLGQEIEECYMTDNILKVWFRLTEGMDADTALAQLAEKDPYMEYTNADGESFQVRLNLGK